MGPRIITAVGATEQGGVVTIGGGRAVDRLHPRGRATSGRTPSRTPSTACWRPASRCPYSRSPWAIRSNFRPRSGTRPLHAGRPGQRPFLSTAIKGPASSRPSARSAGSGEVSIIDGQRCAFVPGPTGSASFSYTVDGKYEAIVWVSLAQSPRRRLGGGRPKQRGPAARRAWPTIFAHLYPYSRIPGPRWITGVTRVAARRRRHHRPGWPIGATISRLPISTAKTASRTPSTASCRRPSQVQVIRRVRDDQFRVDEDAGARVAAGAGQRLVRRRLTRARGRSRACRPRAPAAAGDDFGRRPVDPLHAGRGICRARTHSFTPSTVD